MTQSVNCLYEFPSQDEPCFHSKWLIILQFKKRHLDQVSRLAQTVVSPSAGAVTHPVLGVVDFPKLARQWLLRAGRVQRQSKVSALTREESHTTSSFLSLKNKSSASLLIET